VTARIGIRREDKSRWERRVPITPTKARELRESHGIEFFVQPSPIRVFREAEFEQAGVHVQEDLCPTGVIFAVKEIPLQYFQARPTSSLPTSSRANPTTCPC